MHAAYPRLYTILTAILLLAASCLPKRDVLQSPTSTTRSGQITKVPETALRSQSVLEYIDRYRPIAIQQMQKHGIPASIKLAQAILESNYGNSRLAREANNHFGIKCAGAWRGPRIFHDDDERNDCFRSYDNAEASFVDHSHFLLRKRYERLFTLNQKDYRAWAHGLKDAGYATNPRYAHLLINLIERYELYEYDQSPKIVRKEAQNTQNGQKKAMRIHEVTPGETVATIAKRYGISATHLLKINNLRDNHLHIGQMLVVSD